LNDSVKVPFLLTSDTVIIGGRYQVLAVFLTLVAVVVFFF
jgi:hypothetical protein